jgi:hypothetical protein
MSKAKDRQLERTPIRRPRLLHQQFRHLYSILMPLVSATTGYPHPDFPRDNFAYHLLTSEQLDRLASHYHQNIVDYRRRPYYPKQVPSCVGNVDVATKRRRFGRFIGLKDCESPVDNRKSVMEIKMREMVTGLLNGIESTWLEGRKEQSLQVRITSLSSFGLASR